NNHHISANSKLALPGTLERPDQKQYGCRSFGMRNAAESIMNKIIASLTPARLAPRTILIGAVALLTSAVLYAQPTNSSPDPKAGAESTGTIKEYTPGSVLVLNTLAPSEPTQFKLSKSVVYVDADGKTIDSPALTKDQKVRVHYMKTAGENVADRVILIKD